MTNGQSRKVGVIGYGLAGRVFHAPLIDATPGLDVAAIVTSDPLRASQARRDFPDAQVSGEVDAVLAGAGRVDLVVVATPNESHIPLGLRAVESGLPVVVDKPLAATVADGRRLVERAREAGVMVTVFQNRRWDSDFLTLRRLVAQGRLGRIHRYESRFERWIPQLREGSWRENPDPAKAGGLLYDLGAHLIDQALVLFGSVTSVYAELVALTHAGGVRSHLWASALTPQLGPRFRVLGDQAGYTSYGLDPQEMQLAAGLRPGSPEWGRQAPERDGILGVAGDNKTVPSLPGAYQDFYSVLTVALDGGAPPPVDPWNSVAVLEIIEAAQRSAANHIVVSMSPDGGSPR